MKRLFSSIIATVLLVCIGFIAIAVPAYPYQISVKQSDKSLLSLFLKGDEKVNWAKTTDGFTLLKAKNGDFVYAISDSKGGITPSNIIAHNEGARNSEELNFIKTLDNNLFFSSEQLRTLKQIWEYKKSPDFQNALNLAKTTQRQLKILVLLVEYPDRLFVNNAQYFDNLFNQVGYNEYGNEGSVKDYFNASTYGNVTISAGVYGPFMASAGCASYCYQATGNLGAQNLLNEAINLADPTVNFADYCSNGSSYVDCVFMIFAGCAASSGEDNAIWPHRSVLYPPVEKDGVYLYNYGCASELQGSTPWTTPPTVGTICHEFSHVLGLDDNYDTDYGTNGQATTSDEWDVMSSGNYNNGGKTPPLWSAFQRMSQGYLDIIELNSGVENKTLPPLSTSNVAYKLTHSPSEYFILENRQKEGWDRFLPGHGMLITHIDKSVPGWNYNCANCDPSWLGINLLEANASTPYNRPSNPFPGTSNVTSFTDSTNPSSLSNDGSQLNKPIERIQENTTTKNITFDFGGVSSSSPRATTNSITRVTSDSIYVSVTVSQTTNPIIEKGLIYSTSNNPIYSNTRIINTESSNDFTSIVTNIQPTTTYYVRAYVKNSLSTYFYGEVIRVDVPCASIRQFPYNNSFENNDNTISCWGQEGNSFQLNTWKYVSTTDTGGITSAQSGTQFAYLSSSYQSAQTRKLITPSLDISILSQPYIKFYYAIKQKGDYQDALRIYYKTSSLGTWQLLKTYNNDTPNWTMDSIMLPNKSDTYYIGFEGELYSGYGVCIDNVIVSEANLVAFPSVATLNVDNITDVSARVTSNLISQGYTTLSSRGIVWSTNPYPTINDSSSSIAAGAGQYIITANNLESNTVYYFRSYARNQGLISYGNQITILTKCERISSFPYDFILESSDTNCFEKGMDWQLTNQDVAVTAHSGTNFFMFKPIANDTSKLIIPLLNLSNHTNTKLKFWYQKPFDANTLKVYYRIGIEGEWNQLGLYNASVNSWTLDSVDLPNANDNYYIAFEGISQNGNGIYIDDISVEAILQIPLVQTTTTTLATYNSIQTGGDVSYSGMSSVIERGVCWSINGTTPTIMNSKIIVGSGLGTFSSTLTNLFSETTYKIRAYATNSYGTNYGQEYIITTPPMPILNNTISGDQELCYNSTTQTFQGSLPTGGNGQYQYLWLQSPDDINWDFATDSDFRILQNYYSFRAIESAYYKRVVNSRLVSDTSNTIFLKVYPETRAGNVFRGQDTITINQGLRMELRAFEGSILKWERKKLDFEWQEIENSQDSIWLTDSPSQLGMYYYRARVKSGTCVELISGEDWTYVKRGIGLDNVLVEDGNIIVSPNPSNGGINVQYNKDKAFIGELKVYDINSKELKNIESQVLNKGNNAINLNPINNGTYLLVFKNDKIIMTKIIIINK